MTKALNGKFIFHVVLEQLKVPGFLNNSRKLSSQKRAICQYFLITQVSKNLVKSWNKDIYFVLLRNVSS